MPDDLRKAIVEAISQSGDDNYKRLLLLLLRVEEVFIEKIDELSDQMTVPAKKHADHHAWIEQHQASEGTIKSAFWKIAVSLLEKGALVAAGALVAKLMGAA